MKGLDKKNYGKALSYLEQASMNTLFARAVLEHKVSGQVFVDDTENPQTWYVVHPYGMSLLFGDSSNGDFNNHFLDHALNRYKTRNTYEWMQAFPDTWHTKLHKLLKGYLIRSADNTEQLDQNIVELNTRVNFVFNHARYHRIKRPESSSGIKIVRTDRQIFRAMKGSVVPKYFWDSEDDFLKNGIGYSVFYKGNLASTAYSSCMYKNQLELGIETVAEFRGLGLAEQSCLVLIDYCLENHFEPVWACRLENRGSYQLAKKLGFDPSLELPYYRLSN